MKLGLCTWSYNRSLGFHDPKTKKIDFEEMIKICAKRLKLGGIDIITDLLPKSDKAYLNHIKKLCTDLQLTICCLSPGNNFCQEDEKALKEQIAYVEKWLDAAVILGAPVLRVFAGWISKEKQKGVWPNVVKAFKESAKLAEQRGVTLAIESHNDGGLLPSSIETFQLLKDIDSSWVKLNLDTGNYHDKDNYAAIEKSMPYAVHIHAKIHKLSPQGEELEFDYEKIFNILKKHDYRGFISPEYEGKEDEMEYVPKTMDMIRRVAKKVGYC